ncbi:MAG: PIN domain-containing protein [Pseudomonadota bacterium]
MDRLLLDACVLFPTTLREILTEAAKADLFTPLWSDRILEEWRRAEARRGGDAGVAITLFADRFAKGRVVPEPLETGLPDANDVHVLEAAVAGQAEAIMTFNLRDFPGRVLARHGVMAVHPDALLLSLFHEQKEALKPILTMAHANAQRAIGRQITPRTLFKKAQLPRVGKAFSGLSPTV